MIQPFARDEAFLEDLRRPPGAPDELRIWWLGQSGFLLKHEGSFLLFDPYLSDSLTEKYAGTNKPHIRMTERVIDPSRLEGISVITSSHNHTDHLDAATLKPLFEKNPGAQFLIPEANRSFVANRVGCEEALPIGLDAGVTVNVGGWKLTGVASAHNELETDELGRHRFLGFVAQRGPWTVYHSGDTLLYPGLADTLAEFAIDVAFLPINGNVPARGVAGNMDGREAAELAKSVSAGLVIPHHFEMFEFNTADPRDLFIPECVRADQPYHVLRAGEGYSLHLH